MTQHAATVAQPEKAVLDSINTTETGNSVQAGPGSGHILIKFGRWRGPWPPEFAADPNAVAIPLLHRCHDFGVHRHYVQGGFGIRELPGFFTVSHIDSGRALMMGFTTVPRAIKVCDLANLLLGGLDLQPECGLSGVTYSSLRQLALAYCKWVTHGKHLSVRAVKRAKKCFDHGDLKRALAYFHVGQVA